MGSAKSESADISEEDVLRAHLYRMLAHILKAPPQRSDLELLAGLAGDSTRLGEAVGSLAHLAARSSPEAVRREYLDLFIGVEGGELVPYGSHYRSAMREEHRQLEHRAAPARRGIAIAPEPSEVRSQAEDHIATLCEIMAGFILGDGEEPASLDEQKAFFMSYIAAWAKLFFIDLEAARSSVFYAAVGKVGAVFMDIEEAAFEMV
jgi:TorA maturation chaperone TorD